MLSILENKNLIAAPAVSPAVAESADLSMLKVRLEDLQEAEHLIAAQVQTAEERVTVARAEFEQAQSAALSGETDPILFLEAAQQRVTAATVALTPIAARLGHARALIAAARREMDAAGVRARAAYRKSLEDRHREIATRMAASLGEFMNASLEMESLTTEAFEKFPQRSSTNAPEVFFSNLRAFVRTGPQRPAWDFLNDYAQIYGIETLPASASEYLLKWVQFRVDRREEELRIRKNVRIELDAIAKGHDQLQKAAERTFHGSRFELLRAAGTI